MCPSGSVVPRERAGERARPNLTRLLMGKASPGPGLRQLPTAAITGLPPPRLPRPLCPHHKHHCVRRHDGLQQRLPHTTPPATLTRQGFFAFF